MSEKPGTFTKGDKRINRKGRPRVFDALRALTLDMFTRPALDAKEQPVLIEGRPATVIEVIMWKKIHSKNPKEVQEAIEVAYGKVPDKHEITGPDGKPLSGMSDADLRAAIQTGLNEILRPATGGQEPKIED